MSSFLLIHFSFVLSDSFISTILSSNSLILSSASVILLLVPSRVFLISFIALLIIYWLFFISSRSLLNPSCIFSILVSRLFICNSILFLRFWIIFTIIIRNSFSGRFPISSSFVWFGGHLSCSFGASLVAQRLKRLPAMQETWVRSLGWEDPLEKEMATVSSILAWRIPWMEALGGLQSMGSQRVGTTELLHLYCSFTC